MKLTADEYEGRRSARTTSYEWVVIFKAVREGKTALETQKLLSNRDRNTVRKIFNISSKLESLRPERMDDELAQQIADEAKYGATPQFVHRMFLSWFRWKEDTERPGGHAAIEIEDPHFPDEIGKKTWHLTATNKSNTPIYSAEISFLWFDSSGNSIAACSGSWPHGKPEQGFPPGYESSFAVAVKYDGEHHFYPYSLRSWSPPLMDRSESEIGPGDFAVDVEVFGGGRSYGIAKLKVSNHDDSLKKFSLTILD